MNSRLVAAFAGVALAVVALAGCTASGGSGSSSSSGSAGGATSSAAAGAASSGSALSTAKTSLGTIVVDGQGMTAYYFDVDKANSGTSACTGGCASVWPAITTTSATPTVKGVTGTIGEITDPAGAKQITIDGRPIYTYAADSKPGDVTGQGVQGVWYVVSPSGSEIK